jgi:hypothetical protein
LSPGRLDNIAVGSENLNAGNGREVTIIGDNLQHAMGRFTNKVNVFFNVKPAKHAVVP